MRACDQTSRADQPRPCARSKFYDHGDRAALRSHVLPLLQFSETLYAMIMDPPSRNLRAWEYGIFLEGFAPQLERARLLDVGPGGSPFSLYLATRGAEVTTVDLKVPFQDRAALLRESERCGVRHIAGNMTRLPIAAESVDLAISISAIEHLHQRPDDPLALIDYAEFLELTRSALRELARVVAPGGALFLTSDLYDPELQGVDEWSAGKGWQEVGGAYRQDDFEPVFLDTLRDAGMVMDDAADFDFQALRSSPARATYRGRYVTTFALSMRKPG